MKKAWGTPKLVILVRSSSPEAVLQFCKTSSGTGASDHFTGCFVEGAPTPFCGVRGDMLGIGNAIVCNACDAQFTS